MTDRINLGDMYKPMPQHVITGRNGDWQEGDTCDDTCPDDPHFHVDGGGPQCLFPTPGGHPDWCIAEHRKVEMTVISDTITTGVEAVMTMGSQTVEDWYLGHEADPDEIPAAER